jgi:hypothetical protein
MRAKLTPNSSPLDLGTASVKVKNAGQSGAKFVPVCVSSCVRVTYESSNAPTIKRRQGKNRAEKKSHFLHFMELTIPPQLVNSPSTMQI